MLLQMQHFIICVISSTAGHYHTYSCAVVVSQKTQVDAAVHINGCKVGKGEHPEGETGHSGNAILNQLDCSIFWIRTPTKPERGRSENVSGRL